MATLTVNCGSFNKTSKSGNTAYGALVNFSIPAGATITGCSVSYVTQGSSGLTADRAFILNGVRAHSSGSWAQAGALNAALLSPGNNTFRVTLKSQTGTLSSPGECWWSISGITLTITYTEGGGGSAPPVGGGGPVVISPSSIDAGAGSITVTCPAEAGIWHMINWSFGTKSGQWSHYWETGGTGTIEIPLSWIEEIPNATQGTLNIRVRRSTTPSEPYSYATDQTTAVTIKVPAAVVPTVSAFTATLVANGVPGTISGYVQGKSKVALAITATGGSYSSLATVRITGGGIDVYAWSGTFGPFNYSGDIVFTATAVDTRGRSASRQVAINIMPYSAPAFSTPEAWRSNYDGVKNQKGTYVRLKSGVQYSSLEGQNSATLKGRVYTKGGVAPAWETMTPNTELILGGGALLFTRTYIAQIQVSDLLESRITEFIIPTKKTGFSIMAGMLGAAIGKVAEIPGIFDVFWPIYSEGNRVLTTIDCPKAINEVIMLLSTDNPKDLWPGTTWVQLAEGKFPVSAGATYTLGGTGGAASVTLTVAQMPEHGHKAKSPTSGTDGGVKTGFDVWRVSGGFSSDYVIENTGGGGAHENRPPWIALNMWRRTA